MFRIKNALNDWLSLNTTGSPVQIYKVILAEWGLVLIVHCCIGASVSAHTKQV